MARRIIVTLPDYKDEGDDSRDADYIRYVAEQVEEGYNSGHVDVDHHWRIEVDGKYF